VSGKTGAEPGQGGVAIPRGRVLRRQLVVSCEQDHWLP
jgi:hypothetical protein